MTDGAIGANIRDASLGAVAMEQHEFELKIRTVDDPRPNPVFAHHIQTVTVNEFVSLRFYSVLFPSDPSSVAEEGVEARLSSEVVVPKDVFERLIDNIAGRTNSEEAEEDGC